MAMTGGGVKPCPAQFMRLSWAHIQVSHQVGLGIRGKFSVQSVTGLHGANPYGGRPFTCPTAPMAPTAMQN